NARRGPTRCPASVHAIPSSTSSLPDEYPEGTMKSLTWNQVNAWRLAQHGLAPRLTHEALVEVPSRLYGIHAQVMSAAELALGARMEGLTPQAVRSALWEDRTLVKTWAMRGTLHLLAAD